MAAKDEFRSRDMYGDRGYMVHDRMCAEIDRLRHQVEVLTLELAVLREADI